MLGFESEFDAEGYRMNSEKELVDAFEAAIHEDFPNPDLIDCPEHERLLKLAEGVQAQPTQLFVHIRKCAPCFDELKKLRGKARNQSPQDI